jgi:hypothetical protein
MRAIDLASSSSSATGITFGQTALIGLIAAAVGAIAAIVSAALTAKWARDNALVDRRQAAYDAFVGSHDELYRLLNVPGAVQAGDPGSTFGTLLGAALGGTSRAYASVVLVGSDAVLSIAERWQERSWETYDWFYPASGCTPMTAAEVSQQLDQRRAGDDALAEEFRHKVRSEVAGESRQQKCRLARKSSS